MADTAPLIDRIEDYGRRIHSRQLTLTQAAEQLVAECPESFTLVGAEDVLSDWPNARTRYAVATAPERG